MAKKVGFWAKPIFVQKKEVKYGRKITYKF